MNNVATFLKPGEMTLNFLLGFFESHQGTIDPTLYVVFSGMISTVIWSWALRICLEVTKRAFGFGGRGNYR